MPEPLELVCPACAGRSAVDPEYRGYPLWSCPFCAAENPMPASPPPPGRRRPPRGPLVATVLVAAVTAGSLATHAARRTPPYRTAEGIAGALAAQGLGCADPAFAPASHPSVREEARCRVNGATAVIRTFSSERRRAEYVGAQTMPRRAEGATWIVETDDSPVLDRIADALGGTVVPPT